MTSLPAHYPARPRVPLCGYRQYVRSLQAHTDDCFTISVDPTNRFVAVGSKDSLVSLWDLEDMICLRSLGEHTTPVSPSPTPSPTVHHIRRT